jgi:hypothetical protein
MSFAPLTRYALPHPIKMVMASCGIEPIAFRQNSTGFGKLPQLERVDLARRQAREVGRSRTPRATLGQRPSTSPTPWVAASNAICMVSTRGPPSTKRSAPVPLA